MNLETDIKVLALQPEFHKDPLRVPLKFGAVVVSESTSLNVKAIVETRSGKDGEGLEHSITPRVGLPGSKRATRSKVTGNVLDCRTILQRTRT